MEFTELPFEYTTRYGDQYKKWNIPMERAALLEERDRELEDYLAGLDTGGGVVPTYLVASSDSTSTASRQEVQDAADYTCDGTADQTEIEAAVTAAKAVGGGGRVFLAAGYYKTTATIELSSNVGASLVGTGPGSLIFGGSAYPVLDDNGGAFTIRDLYLEAATGGSWTSYPDALGVAAYLRRSLSRLEDCYIYASDVAAFVTGADVHIVGNKMLSPEQYGVLYNGTGGRFVISGNYMDDPGLAYRLANGQSLGGLAAGFSTGSGGIVITSGEHIAITGNIINNAGNHGIAVAGASHVSISGNAVDMASAADAGIHIENGVNVTASGNSVVGDVVVTGATTAGMTLQGNTISSDVTISSDGCVVVANHIGGNLTVSGDNNVVIGNIVDGTLSDTGTGNTVANNG